MDILDVFRWSEEEVIGKFIEVIKEPPTLADDNNNYAFWNRKSPFVIQAHIDVVEGSKWDKRKWDNVKRDWVDVEPVEKDEKPSIFRIRNLVGRKNGVLGGDDRAGVMAIIHINDICRKYKIPPPSILLTNHEESGGTGMAAFIDRVEKDKLDLLDQVRLVVALDRRGACEYVQYCGSDMPKPVLYYVESFGFNSSHGSWSDSKKITSKWKIPHVNLSVGYYDNHTSRETVHLDEVLLTAKRVCAMLKDPIAEKYEVNEYVYKAPKTSTYYGSYPGVEKDPKKIAAVERRKKRCDVLKSKNPTFFRCTFFPYLDYLLTDALLANEFHVVSTPGNGKPLEEWYWLFDKENKCSVAALWQEKYGSLDAIYKKVFIKSAQSRLYFLAVSFKNDKARGPYSAQLIEADEEKLIEKQNKEIDAKIKNIEQKKETVSVDNKIVEDSGFCLKYWDVCDGGCHGDRSQCNFPGGPDMSMAGNSWIGMY